MKGNSFGVGRKSGAHAPFMYGSEYHHIENWYSPAKRKEMPETHFHVKSFEGEMWHEIDTTCVTDISWVYWGYRCPTADVRTLVSKLMSVHFWHSQRSAFCSGQCVRTLVNGDCWEGQLVKYRREDIEKKHVVLY